MVSMRFVRGKVMSLARLIATPIPIKTVTRGGETVIREKYAENGVLIGMTASTTPGVEAEEFFITRDGEFLRLSRRRDEGPRGEVHHHRTVSHITATDAIDHVGAEEAAAMVLELVRRRVANATIRLAKLQEAEREIAGQIARPTVVPCNSPLPQVMFEEAEEVVLEEEPSHAL